GTRPVPVRDVYLDAIRTAVGHLQRDLLRVPLVPGADVEPDAGGGTGEAAEEPVRPVYREVVRTGERPVVGQFPARRHRVAARVLRGRAGLEHGGGGPCVAEPESHRRGGHPRVGVQAVRQGAGGSYALLLPRQPRIGRRYRYLVGPAGWSGVPANTSLRVSTVDRPGTGVGGTRWSKKPPSSSYVTNSAIRLHTRGLDARMSTTRETYQAPKSGSQFGCSLYASGATIQDTCGNRPLRTSSRRSDSRASGLRPEFTIVVPVFASSASGVPGTAFWYWWK